MLSRFSVMMAVMSVGLAGAACTDDEGPGNGANDGASAGGGGSGGSGGADGGGGSAGGGAGGAGGRDAAAGLRWFTTCGDPVCRVPAGDAGAPTTGVSRCQSERAGDPCTQNGAMCDPGMGCGVLLRCTDRDPKTQPGGCPISRRASKRDVRYLDEEARARLEAQVRGLRLATYEYKDAPGRERLGFLIDDAPGSPAVDAPRDMIDLYGYTSMVVAAFQRQAARLDAQEKELAELRAAVARQCPKRPRTARAHP